MNKNDIYIFVDNQNNAVLKYEKCNIETIAYIGKAGVTKSKIEGDGKTPLGEFKLGKILCMNCNIKNVNGLKCSQITKEMYWIDDCKSKNYNNLVYVSKVEKDWKTAEHLIDYKFEYEFLIEIKTNPNNIVGKGSAIFLHCINNKLDKTTVGCISVERNAMKKLVENVDKDTKINIQLK